MNTKKRIMVALLIGALSLPAFGRPHLTPEQKRESAALMKEARQAMENNALYARGLIEEAKVATKEDPFYAFSLALKTTAPKHQSVIMETLRLEKLTHIEALLQKQVTLETAMLARLTFLEDQRF